MYSEQQVQINATQLSNACQGTLSWYSATATAGTAPGTGTGPEFVVTLDNDGNATAVVWGGPSCAATKDLITADLITTSSVAVIFYAEFPSVYAERTVEFSDAQLFDRCAGGITWVGPDEVVLGTGKSATTTLDNNGNAFVVALAGPSCASGKTLAQVDLTGAPYTTITKSFTVLSPRVTV